MCLSSETSLPEIVCSPVLDQKEWPRSETLEWLETSTGWYQLDVFFFTYFPNDGFLVNPHRPTPYLFSQSQLLQERRSCHAAGQVDATRGFHGGNLYLQDWHLVKKKKNDVLLSTQTAMGVQIRPRYFLWIFWILGAAQIRDIAVTSLVSAARCKSVQDKTASVLKTQR